MQVHQTHREQCCSPCQGFRYHTLHVWVCVGGRADLVVDEGKGVEIFGVGGGRSRFQNCPPPPPHHPKKKLPSFENHEHPRRVEGGEVSKNFWKSKCRLDINFWKLPHGVWYTEVAQWTVTTSSYNHWRTYWAINVFNKRTWTCVGTNECARIRNTKDVESNSLICIITHLFSNFEHLHWKPRKRDGKFDTSGAV